MTTRAEKKRTKARFFCAYCQTEVSPKAERCPSCGRFFSAVTCPSCGFVGDAEAFAKGCPACGFLVPVETERAAGKGRETGRETGTGNRKGPSASFYRVSAILLAVALALLLAALIFVSR